MDRVDEREAAAESQPSPAAPPTASRGAPPRWWGGWSLAGAWGALVLGCASLTPSLMPRSGVIQGVLAAISAALGYGIGVLLAAVWRALADRQRRPPRMWAWLAWWLVAVVLGTVFFVLGRQWQVDLRALMGAPSEPLWQALLAPVVCLVLFALLIAVARLVRGAARALSRLLSRLVNPRAARAIGALVVGVVVVLLVSDVGLNALLTAADSSFALEDAGTPAGVHRPTSGLRSGGPGSLISWDSLGTFGREFVASGPRADQIRAFAGTGQQPIRIYAGLGTASDTESRARRAVADLDRAGGFRRARLLVATTTGRGWLDSGSMAAFEYIAGGDSAIVAMQYSHLPSPMSYLVDQTRARAAGRDLFDAVYERWATLPPDARPQLYVFGESLGSFGAEAAFSGEFDLRNRTSGALFVGPPNFNALDREFRDGRDPGTREVEPVYRGGRTVRYSTEISRGAPPLDSPWTGPRVLYLQHPSDPVPWWSPSLLFDRPDWLAEPRGRDVLHSMHWIPLVTFWQVTLDMLNADAAPDGHGHRYTRESVDAWATVLQAEGWSAAKADQLRGLVAPSG